MTNMLINTTYKADNPLLLKTKVLNFDGSSYAICDSADFRTNPVTIYAKVRNLIPNTFSGTLLHNGIFGNNDEHATDHGGSCLWYGNTLNFYMNVGNSSYASDIIYDKISNIDLILNPQTVYTLFYINGVLKKTTSATSYGVNQSFVLGRKYVNMNICYGKFNLLEFKAFSTNKTQTQIDSSTKEDADVICWITEFNLSEDTTKLLDESTAGNDFTLYGPKTKIIYI